MTLYIHKANGLKWREFEKQQRHLEFRSTFEHIHVHHYFLYSCIVIAYKVSRETVIPKYKQIRNDVLRWNDSSILGIVFFYMHVILHTSHYLYVCVCILWIHFLTYFYTIQYVYPCVLYVLVYLCRYIVWMVGTIADLTTIQFNKHWCTLAERNVHFIN